ncbi:hypothetical protein [Rheinheimera sp.]|uniref:hypothetical protein n=1 Tax=Rheinheimera sp. TaxID=1869214 RepID=UPI002734D73F|nr:hypothetical protein [Rheinheimera sp.]
MTLANVSCVTKARPFYEISGEKKPDTQIRQTLSTGGTDLPVKASSLCRSYVTS